MLGGKGDGKLFAPPSACEVHYRNNPIDVVKEFNYLGNIFTQQLSSIQHISQIIAKCNGRVAKLFSSLPLKDIPLPVALKVFSIFILPVIQYCLPVWLPDAPITSMSKLNSLFTKYLKRFLGIPYAVNNDVVHLITGTVPLSHTLSKALSNRSTIYPPIMSGIKLFHKNKKVPLSDIPSFKIPEWMNLCPIPLPCEENLPILSTPKRALLYSVLDLYHSQICSTRKCSHLSEKSIEPCFCRLCNEIIDRYHPMTCNKLKDMSVSTRLKSLLDDPK